ncbi:MAG TPA: DMT family transporter [Acidimicrobiales bacterium]|nr:DMT family transporter [Acidimicrobiales bacterium]
MLSYLLAVLAAGCNAASNILQRKANRDEPAELQMSLRLMIDLLHRPVWLAGLVTVIASFLLDGAALRFGRLAQVQPILVLELPLTLVGASMVFRSARLRRLDWTAILVMTAGLAGLIYFLDPSGPVRHAVPAVTWIVGTAATAGAVAACVVAATRGGRNRRPALLGLGAGICFGLTAAFMKSATGALHHGAAGVFESWSTYAMVASGLVAMFLMQNALQAGRLIAAQPGITLADPGVAILWGVFAFGERVRGGAYAAGAVAGGLAVAVGVVLMSRSPLLADQATENEDRATESEDRATESEDRAAEREHRAAQES